MVQRLQAATEQLRRQAMGARHVSRGTTGRVRVLVGVSDDCPVHNSRTPESGPAEMGAQEPQAQQGVSSGRSAACGLCPLIAAAVSMGSVIATTPV